MISPAERRALTRAVALAQTAVVTASPNPGVGCVVTSGDTVVGEGATHPVGGPHAEVVALGAARERARGATLHVTLEPCAHHGRTPPCVDAIVAAGVRRVVVAHPDPHPDAAGGGAALRAAGIEVVGPLPPGDPVRAAVSRQLEGFLTVVALGRPHVTLKLAQTSDGELVAPAGQRWLTGAPARAAVHRWRASRDAVLVGSGTVLADDPRLDARDVPVLRQPRPVVLDGRLRTPPSAQLLRRRPIVVTRDDACEADAGRLRVAGAEVVGVPADPAGGVALAAALGVLAARGVTSLLAEPGATLAAALLRDQLVDRLVLHVAGHLGSGPPRRALELPAGQQWRTERLGGAGTDLVFHLVPVRPVVADHATRDAGEAA